MIFWLATAGAGIGSLLLLGVIQGATEFLPVSSSGHLVLFATWLGLQTDQGLAREVALHAGTLVAVLVFCWRDLRSMLSSGSRGLWTLMLGATLVTGVVGLSLESFIEERLSHPLGVGIGLLVTTLLLAVVAPQSDTRQTRTLDQGTWQLGLLLGLFQSLALMPGISRAGSTIVGALLLGFTRPHAVRIAFLISVPAVGGAVVKKLLLDGDGAGMAWEPPMLAAMLVACLVGMLALRVIAVKVSPRDLRMFAIYTGIMAVAALVTALV